MLKVNECAHSGQMHNSDLSKDVFKSSLSHFLSKPLRYPSLLHCKPRNEQSTCLSSFEAPLYYYKIWLASQRMLHFAFRNHLHQSGLT